MSPQQRAALDAAKREMAHAIDLLSVPTGTIIKHTESISYATKEHITRACNKAIDCIDNVLAAEAKRAP